MKEKIGIEDLVGLLNRYHSFPGFEYCYDGIDKRIYIRKTYPGFETQEEWVENEWICSKRFGFIKWLVENDKIDTDPIRTRVKRVYVELEPREFTPQDFTDRVIMLLSISNSPIEDLISYLK